MSRGKPKQNALDKIISYIDPERAAKRMHARYRIAAAGGYKSGDRSRKAFKNWGVSKGSADAESLPFLELIRSDSRDLLRNAPIATGAINTAVTNVIGTGLRPQSLPDINVLKERAKLSDEQIRKFVTSAERWFKMWATRDCDASRAQTFDDIQELVFRSVLESGDTVVIKRMIQRIGRRMSTALQVIEADRLTNPQGQADRPQLCAGVEKDSYGAAVAYHILDSHPGDLRNGASRKTVRIPAYYTNGEWQVLHIFRRIRPEQTRGIPYLAPVIETLKQLDRYTEAEIMAAVVSGMFTVFVTTEDGEGLPSDATGSGSSKDADKEIGLGYGSIIDLRPNESVNSANPGRPNTAFDPFVIAILRQIGSALEIPFEILIKHFTASYSASQAAFMEAWKFFRGRRKWIVDSLCQPTWESVIAEGVALGEISAPGFFTDPMVRAAYLNADWIGPPRGMIDAKKEAEANEIAERKGWKTNAEITAEMTGGDFERKHHQRVQEYKMLREAGLAPEKAQDPAPQPQPPQPQNDNPDQEDENVDN